MRTSSLRDSRACKKIWARLSSDSFEAVLRSKESLRSGELGVGCGLCGFRFVGGTKPTVLRWRSGVLEVGPGGNVGSGNRQFLGICDGRAARLRNLWSHEEDLRSLANEICTYDKNVDRERIASSLPT